MLYASLPLRTRQWGGLHSSRWTRVDTELDVVGIRAVAWKPSQDNGGTCKALDMSRLDLFEISLFNVDA